MIDQSVIKTAVENILKAIGDDPGREGLKDTPQRVAQMYTEIFGGMAQNPVDELKV